jgi:hypothetical protein
MLWQKGEYTENFQIRWKKGISSICKKHYIQLNNTTSRHHQQVNKRGVKIPTLTKGGYVFYWIITYYEKRLITV